MTQLSFPATARRKFMQVTYSRYRDMGDRVARKFGRKLPFTLEQFREWMLAALGNAVNGFFTCRYCLAIYGLDKGSVDHAVPLSRGGPVGLDNLELICEPCNARKGSMYPEEYFALLQFLEHAIPYARTDVLKRLQMANKLAAGSARNIMVIRKLKGESNGKQNQDIH
jgi:5-methylcytosine-specific restriction endonuclease McrA